MAGRSRANPRTRKGRQIWWPLPCPAMSLGREEHGEELARQRYEGPGSSVGCHWLQGGGRRVGSSRKLEPSFGRVGGLSMVCLRTGRLFRALLVPLRCRPPAGQWVCVLPSPQAGLWSGLLRRSQLRTLGSFQLKDCTSCAWTAFFAGMFCLLSNPSSFPEHGAQVSAFFCVFFLFFFFFMIFKILFVFNGRIIALNDCVGFLEHHRRSP